MRRAFQTFIGVDLGGGKGKTTAVARLVATDGGRTVRVEELVGTGTFYDERLLAYLREHAAGAVLAFDAPLTLPACVRCVLPACPGQSACEVAAVRWFRERALAASEATDDSPRAASEKPRYTPYTQRATEVILHEEHGILPRETLGQGMGPLTSRAAYLRRALAGHYELNRNLLEVYPKATLSQLFPDVTALPRLRGIEYLDGNGQAVTLEGRRTSVSQLAQRYKRSGDAEPMRRKVLDALTELHFAPGQWRQSAIDNDHQFDALIAAYTAFLWARDDWRLPTGRTAELCAEDGWIWFPPRAT